MQATTLSEVFSHPSFLTLLLTLLIVIGNVLIGVSMLPEDVRRRRYRLHRLVYFLCIASFLSFLYVTHRTLGNAVLNYVTFGYFLIVIPLSRKLNVTLHAVLSSIGLVLLILVAALGIL